MPIVNFRIKDPNREYYYLGDHILQETVYTPIEISDLSTLVMDNVLKSMDAETIEADITSEQLRNLLTSQVKGVQIVADIPERDALLVVADDVVLVQDIGDGTWAKYQWTGSAWVLIEAEGSNVIPDLVTLGDTNIVAPGAAQDGWAVKWDNTSGKFILAADETGAGSLTAAEIKTLYESNSNTNAYTDAEKLKLLGIEPNAKDDQTASQVPYTPGGNILSNTVQSAIEELDAEKASSTHTHSEYSLTSHNHDTQYSNILHNHDTDYAAISHTHTEYSLTSHNHDSTYSAIGHNHDGTYAPTVHNHDLLYSPLSHNHDSSYAPISHNHDTRYEQLFGNPTTNGEVLTRDLDGTTYWSAPSSLSSAEINDAVTSLSYTWSSTKLSGELSNKADSNHNHDTTYAQLSHIHDDRYYTESESDAKYAPIVHNHDSSYAVISHSHTFDSLSNVSITGNTAGETIIWNGTSWINSTLAEAGISEAGHNHDAAYSAISHTHNGLFPTGGTAGQIAVKNSATDYDYSWADAPSGGGSGNTTVNDFIIELGAGLTVAERIAAATNIPAGWTVAGADTAGVGNFSNSADTLVMIHNLGKMAVNIHVWEESSSGPALVQGSTKIDLSSQGTQKNALDRNSCAVIGLQPLTTSSRPLYIHVQLG